LPLDFIRKVGQGRIECVQKARHRRPTDVALPVLDLREICVVGAGT
jgi:hypothetical protein